MGGDVFDKDNLVTVCPTCSGRLEQNDEWLVGRRYLSGEDTREEVRVLTA